MKDLVYFGPVWAPVQIDLKLHGLYCWYSDKTDHGQNGPDKTDHVSGQNGPRHRTQRTTFQDKTDHVSGKTDPVLGLTGPRKKIADVLQRSKESSQYP